MSLPAADRALALVALFALTACSKTSSSGPLPPTFAIDAGFLFGAAVAGYQVEGGDDFADWKLWEEVSSDAGVCRIDGCAQADDGPDFATH